MPAREHRFTDPLPVELYLDTDIVIAAIISTEPHHESSRLFMDRLARHGATEIYVSSLLWLELTNVLMREQFRQQLGSDVRRHFQVNRWQDAGVRRSLLRHFLTELEVLLTPFAWYEVSFSPEVREVTTENIASYAMRPHDAAHLATAQYVGVAHIASFDEGFRRVDDLEPWNDRIHG